MKRSLLLLLMLCTFYAHAQVSDAWKTQIESTFQHVNRTPVTTGLLNDYGLYFTNIDKFNGIPSDTNYIELNEWQMLYTSLYTCRFNSNAAAMPDPPIVFAMVDSLSLAPLFGQRLALLPPTTYSNKILFAGLHYNYERFKSNAVPSLVYVSNNKIYDTPGRLTTPYEIKEAFAVVPTRSVLEGASHTFMFSPELFYTNTGKTISTVNIDFGDGAGYRNVSANEPIPIVYDAEGMKTMRIKITYTDQTFKESRTKIEVTDVATSMPVQARYGDVDKVDEKNFPLAGFHAPKPYQGVIAKALVTIGYANTDKKIRKPLIVVEGFDTWKIKHPDNPEKNLSFKRFLSTEYLRRAINYTHGGKSYDTLSHALEEEGFDIIFIDFDNGTDYIQRNAYLVENVIEWVNSVKEPYNGVMQKNVVLGASMGGLIARYALRDMELSNPVIDHDTRLYASLDTPHQGANFPLSFQALVSHLSGIGINPGAPVGITTNAFTLGNLLTDLGSNHRVLNTPAAKQMLMYSVVGAGESIAINNSVHQTFKTEYVTMGYPQLGGIRNIVIASGSECGETQGYAPYAEYVNYHGKFRLDLWSYLASVVLLGQDPMLYVPLALTSRTDLRAQIVLNALPNQTGQRIYKGRVYVQKKILWGLITVNVNLFDKPFNALVSCLPVDNYGGGSRGFLDAEEEDKLPFSLIHSKFSFIPTYSALDIGGGQQPITLTEVTRPYSPAYPPVGSKNVKAHNFFTNPTEGNISNEAHVAITLRNGRWLFQEIMGQTAFFSCSANCVGTELEPTLTGPSLVCASGSQSQFTLNNVPLGAAVTWQIQNGKGITPASGTGASATITFGELFLSGSRTIVFTITTGCGSVQLQKTFYVGSSVAIESTSLNPNPQQPCPLDKYYSVPYLPGVSYQWGVTGSYYTSWFYYGENPPNYQENAIYVLTTSNDPFNISVTMSADGCSIPGTSTNQTGNGIYCDCYYDPYICPEQGGGFFSVYPNPANNYLDIEIAESEHLSKSFQPYEIVLFDNNGAEKLRATTSERSKRIDTSSFKIGQYFLHVLYKGEVLQKQILISR